MRSAKIEFNPKLSANKLRLALTIALGLSSTVQAQFPSLLELSDLNGNNGFVLHGEDADDHSGRSVSNVGDVNGDAVDDFVIGAEGNNSNNNNNAGRAYLVYGNSNGFNSSLNLSDIDGNNGFVINGDNAPDGAGNSVSAAGDINDDGIADILIAAHTADPGGRTFAGSTYVIYGKTSNLTHPFNLANINGVNGFAINGVIAFDQSGKSVSAAGDVNGDNIDDLIIGAFRAHGNGVDDSGSVYVVYGNSTGLPNPLNLSGISGLNGFVMHGSGISDRAGNSVSNAGDINGDGMDDIVIGSYLANPNGLVDAGVTYVVFGRSSNFSSSITLSTLNGNNGFVINGNDGGDFSGFSVSAAGDINGDNIDDIVIGAMFAEPAGLNPSGVSYVVYGKTSGLFTPFNVSNINGLNGFIINGVSSGNNAGISVSDAGDINNDGIDDIIIGADLANPSGNGSTGASYVIYGSTQMLPSPFNLSDLNGANGFVIGGVGLNDHLGLSVSKAGDVNGDGFDDIIVSAPYANPVTGSDAGSTYVVFGKEQPIFKNGFEN